MTTLRKRFKLDSLLTLSPSTLEWALLLLALLTAVFLRFWRLDQLPPGLYRDEAFNGLDALKVLQGKHALFFPGNNGREPLYIYLSAIAISLFGPTILAIRFTAALVGSLTTLPVYLLGKSWFGSRVAILAAWLWAITLWPIHLSRLGLRVILLAPLLTLTFWLGTLAYQRRNRWLWILAGLMCGTTFYTYLPSRIIPLLFISLGFYLFWIKRRDWLWPGAAWFALGVLVAVLPLILLTWQQPDWIFGRSGQVSIFHPDVNGGNPLGTLARNLWAALGMFFIRGDDILRHNPAGRPVFDLLMAIPFLMGLFWCLKNWRKPAAMSLLLWASLMLVPTVLAADAPHFLRAAGVLPAIVFFPAIGLRYLWQWNFMPPPARTFLVVSLLAGSLLLTVRDYKAYGEDPEVAYYFEAAAAKLAHQINDDGETAIYLDERLWSSWPSISFLVTDSNRVTRFSSPDDLPGIIKAPAAIYAWPYDSLEYIPRVLANSALVTIEEGGLARGDLEETPYTLVVRYGSEEMAFDPAQVLADFNRQFSLVNADVVVLDDSRLQVDLYWRAKTPTAENPIVFVHVEGPEGLIGQDDNPIARGRWPETWWQTGLTVQDRHLLTLVEPYDSVQQQIIIGLYEANTGRRLPVVDEDNGIQRGDSWLFGDE